MVLFAGQSPSTADEFVGKVERVNRAESSIAVRDRMFGTRVVTFFVPTEHEITRDGQWASFSDVKAGDVVTLSFRKPGEKRFVTKLDIRPVLWPHKLKVSEAGFLPPQSDLYFYQVEAIVDDQTILVFEVQRTETSAPGVRSILGRPSGSPKRTTAELRTAEHFFVGQIEARNYVPGKTIALDGRYTVAGTAKASISTQGDKVTVSTERQTEGQSATDSKSRVKSNTESRVKTNGRDKTTTVDSKSNTERRVDADTKSQGRSSTTIQQKVTREVTGFLLTPIDGVRP
jgi:hypothetical protein